MTNIKILAFSVLAAFSVGAAHAESTLTVGAGVGVVEQSYKG
ncbi:MipA/OmpV family protein, partial [Escherichia coli]|nr:MipA/OmpV family protein [Escherichia coli]EFA5327323.1 MipA/OmpV family protein [Escherichia coli]EFC5414873.1 MipA/OmpV family protein [Escherichia coli]EHC5053074.1 MipA/OmpV family protein [Escherichia coli]EHC5053366.1 MipA/OmpV family protein [Escherichia coli]